MTEDEASGLARHDLLRVDPESWARLLAGRGDLDGVPHLAEWARRGWPVITRRRDPGEPADHIPAGLPLPPSAGKRRIGLALPIAAASRLAPVTLDRARETAPPAWRSVIDDLANLARRYGLVPTVFGSLSWQVLTGLPYLGPGSDLDLLWPVSGRVDPRFLQGLARIEAAAPMRLDGEIVLPDRAGINWRELLDAPIGGTVLCKGRESLALRPAASFLREAAS
ncbi:MULTISPECIES: malonate decarboxylase holo-[acyl-carrier-protein] synthase [unclassified Methylobacterium]|uniref:malonate decarboxylase holo-[acyl-carrier-protein] synthase n=1 Tax=unclassified Methylobacterium TaxID=2615210 RepID=UPI0006F46FDE|nr:MULTISPECIES: malonate decarboxylase holo-[acyl-carrier-protein] synthase [unclassified Methylobacterium]KQO58262.1 phosphoribosyl-dephospho-CoA transferase [Methylobacterium sp. Leaf86]KQO93705.1 phosphoribosyl-dephospho-CoA transferase [Methylobacterium sp. Leaf91]